MIKEKPWILKKYDIKIDDFSKYSEYTLKYRSSKSVVLMNIGNSTKQILFWDEIERPFESFCAMDSFGNNITLWWTLT